MTVCIEVVCSLLCGSTVGCPSDSLSSCCLTFCPMLQPTSIDFLVPLFSHFLPVAVKNTCTLGMCMSVVWCGVLLECYKSPIPRNILRISECIPLCHRRRRGRGEPQERALVLLQNFFLCLFLFLFSLFFVTPGNFSLP